MRKEFRKDVQGLRALSVLLIFFAHAGIDAFSGGFIAVDVFFVISGYVITGLLLREYEKSGKIKLISFYGKRILRLMPALLIFVVVSLLFSMAFLPPSQQLYQYGAATASIAWFSNIYFFAFDFDYFSPAIKENMFLHTWSLGVEEQFYLLWPLLVVWMLKKSKEGPKVQFLNLISFVAFLSVAFHVLVSQNSQDAAFYLMPARVWQFSIGGAVVYWHMNFIASVDIPKPKFIFFAGALVGLLLIILSAIFFDEHTPYPSWRSMIPSIGAGMVLFFYIPDKASYVTHFLSLKPMVWLGNLSYSFYLWHWMVLFSFAKLKLFVYGLNAVSAIIITLLLSVISYYLVEMPLRRNKLLIRKPVTTLLSSVVLVVIFWLSAGYLNDVSKQDSQNEALTEINAIRLDAPKIYRYKCDTWYHSSHVNACVFGNKDAENTLVLFGDSVVAQWFPLVNIVYPSSEWKHVVLTKSACPIVQQSFYYSRIKREYEICDKWRDNSIKYIQELAPDIVIMGSGSTYPFTKDEWQNGTSLILDQIEPFAKSIKIMASTPMLSFDSTNCLLQAAWLNSKFEHINEHACKEEMVQSDSWEFISEVVAQREGVAFLNFSELICPKGQCSAKVNDQAVYRDTTHLSASFVISLYEKVKHYFN